MRPASPMGRAIRAARIARQMTQRAAADAAGIHPVAWGRIERGEDTPRADTVARIARALGVPVGSLFSADAEGGERG